MRDTQWIEWNRTRPTPREREALLTALTREQKAHLLEHDYAWAEGVGVLWNPPHDEPLRRARFTHGIHFRTERGERYIDSEGSARETEAMRAPAGAPATASASARTPTPRSGSTVTNV